MSSCPVGGGDFDRFCAVLLLRYSGLRLGDAVTLERTRIELGGQDGKDGRLFLRTAKTGARIFVPLPKVLIDALDACPGKQFPLWTGESKKKSVIGNWQRALKKLFQLAKVPNGHAHRFRHTFAAELLLSGANLTNVAQLLGHSLGEDHRKALQRMDQGPAREAGSRRSEGLALRFR
jgi:integrase